MGQFYGRIHIRVKEPKDWLKLKVVPNGLINGAIYLSYADRGTLIYCNDLDSISNANICDIVLDGEGEVGFGDLNMGGRIDKTFDSSRVCDMCSVVKALAEALGDSAVIIADSTYNGSDMSTSRVCYLGNNLRYEYFSWGEDAKLFDKTNINYIREWLASGGFEISLSEKEYLRQFSINLDNYKPICFSGMSRQIRVLKKNVPVVEPTMDKSSVDKIIAVHSAALVGKIFVVTGKLYHFANRNELKALIESNGAKLSETLNSLTDYLITNELNSGSSKIIKAKSLGTSIISEEDLLKLISSDDNSIKAKNEDGKTICKVASSKNQPEIEKDTVDSLIVKSSQNVNATNEPEDEGVVPARDLILIKRGKKYVIKGYTGSKTSIVLPDSIDGIPIVEISSKAFAMKRDVPHNSKIKSITLPSSLESIGKEAFRNCASLEEIVVPKSLMKVGWNAFAICKKLKRVVYTGDIRDWCNIDFEVETSNPLSNLHVDLIVNNSIVSNLVIPDDITEVKANIFCGSNIERVTLGKNVEIIGDYAFGYCNTLTSITILDSVTSIGNKAFYGCTDLTSIEIGNGVTSIGLDAFGGCIHIKNVYIRDIEAWLNINFDKWFSSTPCSHGADLYLNNEKLTELVIPDSVTRIGDKAFYGCVSLTSITIPVSVTSIGTNAFYGCTGLTSAVIPDSVTNISDYVFYGCDKLVIYTTKGSCADEYAKKGNLKVVYM